MLTVSHLTKAYPTPSGPLEVLADVNLDLAPGQSLAIVGPSGAGKSTLLHILGTIDRPTSGKIRLADCDPFALSTNELARFRNQKVGFIFQDHHLLPQLSALENVLVPTLAFGRPSLDQQRRATELLDRVGLASRTGHLPGELSGGERERVAIVRALLNRPVLILADEPTGNLDRKTAEAIVTLLLELQQEQQAILIAVTHNSSLAERLESQQPLVDGELNACTPKCTSL